MITSGTVGRPCAASMARAASNGSPRFVCPAFVWVVPFTVTVTVGDRTRQLTFWTIALAVFSVPSGRVKSVLSGTTCQST